MPTNIYDFATPLPQDYRWNEDGLSLARTYRRCTWALYAVLLVLLCTDLWWGLLNLGGLSIGALICTIISVLVLYLGLSVAAGIAFGNRSLHLTADARHDYVLFLGHKARRMNNSTASRNLVVLAQLDVARNRTDLARTALAGVNTSALEAWRLKLYYLMQLAVHADDASSAQAWYDRYTGIDADDTLRFPKDDVVQSWIGEAPLTADMRNAIVGVVAQRKRHAILPVLYGIMLAHCVFFLGLWTGADTQMGWHLRVGYALWGAAFTALFIVVLAVLTLALLWSWGTRRNGHKAGAARAAAIIGRVALALVALILAGYLCLSAIAQTDGSERILASSVQDNGRTYDYLAVDWTYTTSYYRASDPLLMQEWSVARNWDTSVAQTTNGDSATGQQGTSSGSAGYERAMRSELQAIYQYLVSQGTLEDTGISYDYDAKGEIYAIMGSGSEELDGSTVSYEHRLYDNGEKAWAHTVQEEFVLEKVYTSEERDAELEGFYVVDTISLEVTDEHKTTW